MSYEGYVKYAAGEVISVQCFEGRCRECPDPHLPGDEGPDIGYAPTLENYYCEHGCNGTNDPQGPNADCKAADQIAEILRDPDWGVGMLEDIGEIINQTGRSIEDYFDGRSTWGRH